MNPAAPRRCAHCGLVNPAAQTSCRRCTSTLDAAARAPESLVTTTRITGWNDRREVWAVTIAGVEHRVEIGESFLKVEIYVDGALLCETRKRYTFAGELRQEIDVAGTPLVVYRTRSTARFKVATADVADAEIAGGHRGAVGGLAATAAIMSGFYLWRTSTLRSTAATIATFVFLAISVVSLVVFTRSQRR